MNAKRIYLVTDTEADMDSPNRVRPVRASSQAQACLAITRGRFVAQPATAEDMLGFKREDVSEAGNNG